MPNSVRAQAAALAAVVGVLGSAVVAAAATGTGADALTPYGPARVDVPYKQIDAFRVQCAAVPCTIRMTQRFYARGRPLTNLRELQPGPIIMRRQPSPTQQFVTWYVRADFNQSRLQADLATYGSLSLKLTAKVTDAAGGSASAARTVTLVPTPMPILIAGPTGAGAQPTSTSRVTAETSSPACAGTGLPRTPPARARATSRAAFPTARRARARRCPPRSCCSTRRTDTSTKLVEQRNGQTEVFYYTPGQYPDDWPGGAS